MKPKYTPQQKKFAEYYFRHGIALKAYEQAGYKVKLENGENVPYLKQKAHQIVKSKGVQNALKVLEDNQQAKDQYTIDFIRSEHLRYMELCEANGDMANATRNLEALGKTTGAYKDTLQIDSGKQKQLDELEYAEAKRISNMLLLDKLRTHEDGSQGDEQENPTVTIELESKELTSNPQGSSTAKKSNETS